MTSQASTYELARSQVRTPTEVVRRFWQITNTYRPLFPDVLDLGAGDGRFSIGGNYERYTGIEIDVGSARA